MAMIRKDFHQENYTHLTADQPVLTKKEKRANWWHYHKWHVVLGIIGAICLADLVKDVFHIGETMPDYQVAYVGTNVLSDEEVAEITDQLAALGEDLNNDGQVYVQLNQYATQNTDDNSEGYYYQYAAEVTVISDIESNDSFFFLMEDPETFEADYEVLAYTDGSLPEDGADDYENMYITWGDSGLYLGRRGFWSDKTCKYVDGCEALWEKILAEAD